MKDIMDAGFGWKLQAIGKRPHPFCQLERKKSTSPPTYEGWNTSPPTYENGFFTP
jgi:hypothetical protein